MLPPGVEYYIRASDGVSSVTSGRWDSPYPITIDDRPVVTVVSPSHGPPSGGTSVTISGSNFKDDATVAFGGAVASNATVLSSSQITCTTPAHFPEAVDVTVVNTDTHSGILLQGYTYESDVTTVSLPDSGEEQSAIVEIPIAVANVAGLAAADVTVAFDDEVLTSRGASTGTLTPGWSMAVNTNTAGRIRLAMASTGGTVTGSGSLAKLEFQVVGSPTMTSTLRLDSVSFNDGAIHVEKAAGVFSVNQAFDVAGTVRFWNGGEVIPSVQCSLLGNQEYTGVTDATGSYTVTNASPGDYTLTPSKADGVNGISAYDASLALQHSAGLITLSGHAFTAGM